MAHICHPKTKICLYLSTYFNEYKTMSEFIPAAAKLGILGGGQLGKMLLQKAADFNLECHVLDPSADAPAKHYAHHFVQENSY